MLITSCTQYVSRFGKPSSGHRTRKDPSSPQFPKRAALKNAQTIRKFHSYPMLIRLCSKSSKLGVSITWTKKFQMFKLGFKKGRGTWDQIANICWIIEKAREFQKNIYLCFIDYIKALDHNKLWKTLKEIGIPDHLTCLLRNMYASQEATVRTLPKKIRQIVLFRLQRESTAGLWICF